MSSRSADTAVGVLVEWEAIAALAATDRYLVVHPKQVREFLRAEGFGPTTALTPTQAARLLRGFGVERGVFASLTKGASGYLLSGMVYGLSGNGQAFRAKLSGNDAAAIAFGAEEVVAAVEGLWQLHLPRATVPDVYRDGLDAPLVWAECLERLNRLPTSLGHPGVVTAQEFDELISACNAAAGQNPSHAPTQSALALALATAGDDIEAARVLDRLGTKGEALPLWWLARFWLLARHVSAEQAIGVMNEAARQHPEHLLFPALRADLFETLGLRAEASAAVRDYQALLPGASPPLCQLARTLNDLGRYSEAVARAREAALIFPTGRQVRVELATRLLQSGEAAEAVRLLEGLNLEGGATEEAQARLANAYLQLGRVADAQRQTARALSAPPSPHEWLPRGRAWYELSVAAAHAKAPQLARTALVASRATRFRPTQLDAWLEPIAFDIESEAQVRPAMPLLKVLSPLDLTRWPPPPAPAPKAFPAWLQPSRPNPVQAPFPVNSTTGP